jgi:serine/threonine-protein kinase RsbW
MSNVAAGGRLALVCDRFDRSSVSVMRQKVATAAASQGLRDLPLIRCTVAVHEIVLNAVHHGGGEGRLLLWRAAAALHCLVSDDGPGIAQRYRGMRPQSSGAETWNSRYGLWLAGQLCPSVHITDRAGRGTDVRLEFPLPAGHAAPSATLR